MTKILLDMQKTINVLVGPNVSKLITCLHDNTTIDSLLITSPDGHKTVVLMPLILKFASVHAPAQINCVLKIYEKQYLCNVHQHLLLIDFYLSKDIYIIFEYPLKWYEVDRIVKLTSPYKRIKVVCRSDSEVYMHSATNGAIHFYSSLLSKDDLRCFLKTTQLTSKSQHHILMSTSQDSFILENISNLIASDEVLTLLTNKVIINRTVAADTVDKNNYLMTITLAECIVNNICCLSFDDPQILSLYILSCNERLLISKSQFIKLIEKKWH